MALAQGDYKNAHSRLLETLDLLTENDQPFLALTQTNLAEIALYFGEYSFARQLLGSAVEYAGLHTRRLSCLLVTLARLLLDQPRHDNATHLSAVHILGGVEGLIARSGYQLSPLFQRLLSERVSLSREGLAIANEWQAAWNWGWSSTVPEILAETRLILADAS